MYRHVHILLWLGALILSGCSGASTPPLSTSPAGQPAAVQATQAPAATPTTLRLPAPTPIPQPTRAPAPTSLPESTSLPEPTSAPAKPAPTVPARATTPPEPAPYAPASEILFLRKGALWAFNLDEGTERQIAGGVSDFSVASDTMTIALVRGKGLKSEIWLVQRDGTELKQLTRNQRAEAIPAWTPDGQTLVFASAKTDQPYTREWFGWSHWCAASEIHAFILTTATETSFGPGCDPSVSPDGRRIAYASPPTTAESGFPENPPLIINNLRLMNRQGKNGWNFARAQGGEEATSNGGRLLYAPSWSPDGAQVVYQRFIGNQVEVDINLSEIGGSLEGKGRPLNLGAGWLLLARFAPGGDQLVISENNYGDARGFGGYDNWSANIIQVSGTRQEYLPSGEVTLVGTALGRLARAQQTAWSPDGTALAVELPPDWRPDLSNDEPVGADEQPGEVWLWKPGELPSQRLFRNVDFASPLAWLPPPPVIETSSMGYRLAYPSDWELASPTEFEERTARSPDQASLISAAPVGQDARNGPAIILFSMFIQPGAKEEAVITWPDGSSYREFQGLNLEGNPIAGAIRTVVPPNGEPIGILYLTIPERWPFERSQAQALMAHSGPTP